MKIVSLQIGLPSPLLYKGRMISTGIIKIPTESRTRVFETHIEGDGQADLKVHGGRDKAIYAFSSDAYDWWHKERPGKHFEFGAFGENLTVEGLDEHSLAIGDVFEVGSVYLEVAQPRQPCFKLEALHSDSHMMNDFIRSGRPGVYFRVVKEGHIQSGDLFRSLNLAGSRLTIARLSEIIYGSQVSLEEKLMARELKALPSRLMKYFH